MARPPSRSTVVVLALAFGAIAIGLLLHPRRRDAVEPHVLANRSINLNTAEAHELALLPGIGPRLAERIVAERRSNGPFRSIQDLERVRGIGPRLRARVTPLASVSASGE